MPCSARQKAAHGSDQEGSAAQIDDGPHPDVPISGTEIPLPETNRAMGSRGGTRRCQQLSAFIAISSMPTVKVTEAIWRDSR